MKKIVLNPDNGIVVTQCHGYSLSGQYFSEKINMIKDKNVYLATKALTTKTMTISRNNFCSVFYVKKNFGAIRKFLKIFIFGNLHHKKGLKGGISIDADSGPPRYVL